MEKVDVRMEGKPEPVYETITVREVVCGLRSGNVKEFILMPEDSLIRHSENHDVWIITASDGMTLEIYGESIEFFGERSRAHRRVKQ